MLRLENYLGEKNSREEVFETLQRVKFDVSSKFLPEFFFFLHFIFMCTLFFFFLFTELSPELLLQKDVKFISHGSTNMAIAALPVLLQV